MKPAAWIYAQIDKPSPSCDSLCSSITGPLQTLRDDIWWVVFFVAGIVLAFGIIRILHAGATGNVKSMELGKKAVYAVPLAIVLALVARQVANWASGQW